MRLWHDDLPTPEEDDASHKRRGSLGGEDYPVSNGSPLYAPATGVIRARNGGTGGYTLSLDPDGYDDIAAIEVMHCSSFVDLRIGGPSRRVNEGDLVGYSGGRVGQLGAGSSNGSHTHEHVDLTNGTRTGLGLYMSQHGTQTTNPSTTQPSRKVKKMDILIAGKDTGWAYPYLLTNDGMRRSLQPVELSIRRSAGTPEVGGITQAEFDAIPKRPGSN